MIPEFCALLWPERYQEYQKQVEFGGSVGFVFVYVCLAIPHGFGDLIFLIREQTQIPEVKVPSPKPWLPGNSLEELSFKKESVPIMAKCCKIKQDNYEMYHLRIFSQQVGLEQGAVPQQNPQTSIRHRNFTRGQGAWQTSRCLQKENSFMAASTGCLWMAVDSAFMLEHLVKKPEGEAAK